MINWGKIITKSVLVKLFKIKGLTFLRDGLTDSRDLAEEFSRQFIELRSQNT
jgi:hypothetical protein